MAKRFLTMIVCWVCASCTLMFADTTLLTKEKGWQKLTEMPDQPADYYFTFVDMTRELMLGVGPGANQGTSYTAIYYYTAVDPSTDRSRLWQLEQMTLSECEGQWAMRNAANPSVVFTSASGAAHVFRSGSATEPTQYSGVNLIYKGGYWVVQNGAQPSAGFLGPWSGGNFVNGAETALNKADDGTRAGHFCIYAILRTDYHEEEAELRCPPLTPAWMLGHVAWEDEKNTQEGTLQLIREYREHDIPVDGIFIDSPWSTCYNDFNWDTSRYPQPEEMVAQLKKWGVKPMLWLTSVVNESSADTPLQKCEAYDYAVEQGYGINNSQPSDWWKGRGIQIDFTNDEAKEWFFSQLDKAFSNGFYGLKVDQGEVYFGNTVTTSIGQMSNSDFRKYYYDAMFDYVNSRKPNLGGIVARPFSHQGGYHAGVEKMSMGWCGDFGGDWNGLKLQINNIYQSALTGYGAVGTEVAGFMGAKSNNAQFIRYAQFGCMTASMINGGENGAFTNHLPWWHGNDALQVYRFCVMLHKELVPYMFSTLVDANTNGGALLRNISLTQESHQLGDCVFTKAITSDNNTVSFSLPNDGEWIDFFTNVHYAAGSTVNRSYQLTEFPLFIRTGSVLPLDIQNDITGLGMRQDKGRKSLLLYPGKASTWTFHWPDGDGTDYTDVTVNFDNTAGTIDLSTPTASDFTFILREQDPIQTVEGAIDWTYDAVKQTLRIQATGTELHIRITRGSASSEPISTLLSTEKGYREIISESELKEAVESGDYLFVLADNNYSNVATSASGNPRGELLMGLGQGKNRSNGSGFQAMVYRRPDMPESSPELLWMIEPNGADGYSLRNLAHIDYLFQTDKAHWRIESSRAGTDNTKVLIRPDDNRGWVLQMACNSTSSSSYVGPWEAGEYDPGMECAANKAATDKNGNRRQGHFRIFCINQALLLSELSNTSTVELTVTSARWATCMLPFRAEKPDGIDHIYSCNAYTEMNADGGVLQLIEADHFDAYVPYIVEAEENHYVMKGIDKGIGLNVEQVRSGWLIGAAQDLNIDNSQEEEETIYQNYVLQNHDGRVGFYQVGDKTNRHIMYGRAYLSVPVDEDIEVKAYFFNALADGINSLHHDASSPMPLRFYSVSGQPQHGLNRGVNIIRMSDGSVHKILIP